VLREASSLRDGQAVLGLPGGLRWTAVHQPADYDPPHSFADELSSPPLPARAPARGERHWRPEDPGPELLAGVDAVIHLAGASIGGRFTPERKAEIRDSRILPTRRLAELAGASPAGSAGRGTSRDNLKAFVTASAIGFYGPDRGDDVLTEDSPRGEGFLDDLLDVYLRAVLDPALSGPVNAVAPEPVRNADYTRTLAAVLHRPALLPVPAFGPRLLLGEEGAREIAQASQHVRPERLIAAGHVFRQPELEGALRHLFGRE
jgi:hypothetical protein